MLTGESYRFTDMVFPFLCGHVKIPAGYIEEAELSKMNMLYSVFLFEFYSKFSNGKMGVKQAFCRQKYSERTEGHNL